MNKSLLLVSLIALAHCAPARSPGQAIHKILPLRHVRLFESGIGYFERAGDLTTGELTGLPVPASHMDDALKTLVVLGADSKVTGLSFATTESFALARTRAGMPSNPAHTVSFFDMCKGLRGETVTVSTKTESITGVIIDVEEPSPQPPAPANPSPSTTATDDHEKLVPRPPAHRLVLLTEKDQIIRPSFDDIVSVQPNDPVVAARIRAALEPAGNRAANAQKMLALIGDTHGKVAFGYISEIPLWRATYRVVFGKDKSILQGWALVHNDTDESWHGVEVQLANGQPDSFLFPLAGPRYGRRPMLHPQGALSTIPQLLERTPDDVFGERGTVRTREDDGRGEWMERKKAAVAKSAPESGDDKYTDNGAEIPPEQTTEGEARGGGGNYQTISTDSLAAVPGSNSEASGNLFLYTLTDRLDLPAHSSALVPFLQSELDLQRATYLESVYSTPRAAVRFHNTSKQTLPAGTIAFFADGGFIGESALGRVAADQTAYLTFGVDLDIEAKDTPDSQETKTGLRQMSGYVYVHATNKIHHDFKITNHSIEARKVAIGLGYVVPDTKFTPPDYVETGVPSPSTATLIVDVPAAKDTTYELTVDQTTSGATYPSVDALTPLLTIDSIPQAQRTLLADVIAKIKVVDKSNKDSADLEKDQRETDQELVRLRENLKALGEKNGTDSHTFVTRILAGEDRLKETRKKREALAIDLKAQQEDLKKAIEKLPREQG